MMKTYQHIFMIGVGGMGMAPLAIYLSKSGFRVSGTDDGLTEGVRKQLVKAGVLLQHGVNVCETVDCVVHSSAIKPTHPCLVIATQRGLPMFRRGEMLAQQLNGKKLLAIVGSHGKTTTAAMLAWILRKENLSVGFVGGGLFEDENIPPAWIGESNWVVAEIDESDGSLENFSPHVTLLTNLDWDHADQYPKEADLLEAFQRIFERTSQTVLLPQQYKNTFLPKVAGDHNFFTFGPAGDYQGVAEFTESNSSELSLGGKFQTRTEKVRACGQFNMENALAAFTALESMGINPNTHTLEDFSGIFRRQSLLHEGQDLTVLTDYAHHPTEISSLLQSVKAAYADRKLVVVFQPHRYTRTRQFKKAFAEELAVSDRLVILPVYSAGETFDEEGTSDTLKPFLRKPAEILSWMPGRSWLNKFLQTLEPKTTVLFVGAGSVEKTARVFSVICKHQDSVTTQWLGFLKNQISPKTRLTTQEPLHNKTTIRIGGNAQFFAEPASIEDLQRVLESAAIFGIHHFLLGKGSNLIVAEGGFEGLVLRLNNPFWKQILPTSDGKLELGAGARLIEVANKASSLGMGGFEFLEGIPGTIGGAISMNAGAMGSWIFDLVETVTVLNKSGNVEVFNRSQLKFGYRCCIGIEKMTILRVTLVPARYEEPQAIRSRMNHFASRRKATQPRESSAGCIFRNPDGFYAGQLIEQAGLKGKRIGDAEVSSVHGNFLVNKGKAGYEDVIGLVRHVRNHVKKAHNLELMPEVQLLGELWDNVL